MTNVTPPLLAGNSDPKCEGWRLPEIDVARGYLVLIMLVYHCVLSDFFPELNSIKSTVRFIHTAFLTMAGFLCGWHYLPKGQQEPAAVAGRLITRGIKLLAIFLLANVVLYVIGFHDVRALYSACSSPAGVIEHTVVTVSGRLFTFEILAYISVFLILAGCFMRFPSCFPFLSASYLVLYAVLPTPRCCISQRAGVSVRLSRGRFSGRTFRFGQTRRRFSGLFLRCSLFTLPTDCYHRNRQRLLPRFLYFNWKL